MERLTFDGNFCDIAQCRELPCPYDNNCTQKQVWERLREYEDTGVSPKACAQAVEMEDLLADEYNNENEMYCYHCFGLEYIEPDYFCSYGEREEQMHEPD